MKLQFSHNNSYCDVLMTSKAHIKTTYLESSGFFAFLFFFTQRLAVGLISRTLPLSHFVDSRLGIKWKLPFLWKLLLIWNQQLHQSYLFQKQSLKFEHLRNKSIKAIYFKNNHLSLTISEIIVSKLIISKIVSWVQPF